MYVSQFSRQNRDKEKKSRDVKRLISKEIIYITRKRENEIKREREREKILIILIFVDSS